MKLLFLDCEATTYEKGNPFARRNRLCYVGCDDSEGTAQFDLDGLSEVQRRITNADVLVGFNIKYDFHWLRRYGINFENKRVWDCQPVHFILSSQREAYPSLDSVCGHYGIKGKISGIAEKYWDKGIDTPDIPKDELLAYLAQDVQATKEVYYKQVEEVRQKGLNNLVRLHMDDLLVLQEMEYNGLKFNVEKCLQEKEKVETRLAEIDKQLGSRYSTTPINWNSGDHVSHYLFGGTIEVDSKEAIGIYKTGQKAGQIRYRNITTPHNLPRLLEPIEGSELAKADKEKGTGPWSTAYDVLKQLKQIEPVKLLLERAEASKLLDYLQGWPELIKQKDWTENEVHGQFNQVRARTGRLSSSNPNLQNLPDPVLKLVETKYEC